MPTVAQDYTRPHAGHSGRSGFGRTNVFTFTKQPHLSYGLRLTTIETIGSPLPLTA